jgi:hypothetical protein
MPGYRYCARIQGSSNTQIDLGGQACRGPLAAAARASRRFSQCDSSVTRRCAGAFRTWGVGAAHMLAAPWAVRGGESFRSSDQATDIRFGRGRPPDASAHELWRSTWPMKGTSVAPSRQSRNCRATLT